MIWEVAPLRIWSGKIFSRKKKRVEEKGYVVLFIVVMPLIHILNKTSNKSKYSR